MTCGVKQLARQLAVLRPFSSLKNLNGEKMVGFEIAIRQLLDLCCCQPRRSILCGDLGKVSGICSSFEVKERLINGFGCAEMAA